MTTPREDAIAALRWALDYIARHGGVDNDYHDIERAAFADATLAAIVPADPTADLRADVGRFLRRVGGLTVEFRDGKAFLPVRDDWVGDLEAGYRAALAADTPERPV